MARPTEAAAFRMKELARKHRPRELVVNEAEQRRQHVKDLESQRDRLQTALDAAHDREQTQQEQLAVDAGKIRVYIANQRQEAEQQRQRADHAEQLLEREQARSARLTAALEDARTRAAAASSGLVEAQAGYAASLTAYHAAAQLAAQVAVNEAATIINNRACEAATRGANAGVAAAIEGLALAAQQAIRHGDQTTLARILAPILFPPVTDEDGRRHLTLRHPSAPLVELAGNEQCLEIAGPGEDAPTLGTIATATDNCGRIESLTIGADHVILKVESLNLVLPNIPAAPPPPPQPDRPKEVTFRRNQRGELVGATVTPVGEGE